MTARDCNNCIHYHHGKDDEVDFCDSWDCEYELEEYVPRSCVYTLLQDIKADIDDGYGFQYEEWVEEVKDLPTVNTNSRLEDIKAEITSHIIETNGLNFNSALYIALEIIEKYISREDKTNAN